MNALAPFSCVWTQNTSFWLILEAPSAPTESGWQRFDWAPALHAAQVDATWHTPWLSAVEAVAPTRSAVIPGSALPSRSDIERALRPTGEIHALVDSLWLARDVEEGRLDCYMQKVVDRRGKVVGHEAFARLQSADGGIMGGGAIMHAAKQLHCEYHVDRLLHKHAIERFVAQDLSGYLFINFLTGFIQRPEIYLEGLSEAAKRHHVRAASVMLDVPLSDYVRDLPKLISIAEFCRSRGFSLALDDIRSTAGLAKLIQDIRPAIIKLDRHFGEGLTANKRELMLREVVELAHAVGATVLAEGIENKAMHEACFHAGVDLFQGFYIGMPERDANPSAEINVS